MTLQPDRGRSSVPGHGAARIIMLLLGVLTMPVMAATPTRKDVEYARADDQSLTLDFYRPVQPSQPIPLIIWVHGGAWRAGSKSDVPILGLLDRGYAVASIDYRLSPVAKFPAQIHDIKAAIRWLRAHASELRVDRDRFVIAGGSAGGHLAALVGVTNGHAELEGRLGDDRDSSSDVQAIVSFYGASNLQTILGQSTPQGLKVREPALLLLLGGLPPDVPDLARLASPVVHVDASDPPLFLIHGDADPQMPLAQSREFVLAYEQCERPVELHVVPGGLHGGKGFYEPARMDQVAAFVKGALARSGQSGN